MKFPYWKITKNKKNYMKKIKQLLINYNLKILNIIFELKIL